MVEVFDDKGRRFLCLETLLKLCGSIEKVEINAWTKVAGIFPIYLRTLVNVGSSDVNKSRKFWPKRPHVRKNRIKVRASTRSSS